MIFLLPVPITVHQSIVWNAGHFVFDPSHHHTAESNFHPHLKMYL